MLKALAILSFVILFLPVNGSEKASQPQKDKGETANTSNATFTVFNQQATAPDQGRTNEQSKGYLETLFSANNLPNLGLVIVGGFGIYLAWKTVNATKDSAAAAKLSAEAVINSERAWVQVLPYHWSVELFPAWEQGDPLPATNPYSHKFPAKIKNVGKTPAVIEELAIFYKMVKGKPSDLPVPPNYANVQPSNTGFNEGLIFPDGEWIADDVWLTPNSILTKRDVQEVRLRDAFLYAYGIVRYRDVMRGDRHETRFGYALQYPRVVSGDDKATFHPDGPQIYNGGT